MKCEMIKEKIDLLIFEENKQLDAEISSHIENCDTCQSYFSESMGAKKIILSLIDDVDQSPKSNKSNPKIYLLMRRSLAAASISLMIVFGIEQYMLFDKISKMEEHVSFISSEPNNVNLYNITNYNLGFQPESFNRLFAKAFNSPGHLNLKSRIIRTRLSAMAINKLNHQRIGQIMQEMSARSIHNTN